MLNVYKSFHQTVKYCRQGNHILQGLLGLKLKFSMKASKIENQFEIGFQQLKTDLLKNLVLASLVLIY